MPLPPRKLAFILAATDQGSLIVNRFDFRMTTQQRGYGVGHMLLEQGSYDAADVAFARQTLGLRRRYFGDGVVAVDCGANIGVFTVEWAKAMTGWGSVLAIEAQERLFYALAGNIALNNCFNARAVHAAVAAEPGTLRIPVPDYTRPSSFGSLELRPSAKPEFIGQKVDYATESLVAVPAMSIDSLALSRLDLLKVDVEGMELEVLEGARQTIARCKPVMVVEQVKSGAAPLTAALEGHGYHCHPMGMNLLAIHPSDPTGGHLRKAD